MIATVVLIRTLTILALCAFTEASPSGTESGAEYLRKAMLELQNLNLPAKLAILGGKTDSFRFDVDDAHYPLGKRHSSGKRILPHPSLIGQYDTAIGASMLRPVAKQIRPNAADPIVPGQATNDNSHYQVSGATFPPSQMVPPMVSSKPEVGPSYEGSPGKGSLASLNALANILRNPHLANVMIDEMNTGNSKPTYSYYYYPLRSFIKDVDAATSPSPEQSGSVTKTQKNMANPLFMAISGFVGMALVFMISVLFFPRFANMNFQEAEGENLIDLTQNVGDAIDRYNCTEKQDLGASFDHTIRAFCRSVNMSKPSSVMLLTRKSMLRKEMKRRRKTSKKCKVPPCKTNHERNNRRI